MCGILGIVNIGNPRPVEAGLLSTMAASMTHRGPDDAGVWIARDGLVGFAHRRLSIIDLSAAGHQPMATPDESLWITFNGEIYNYRTLRRQLEAAGYAFRSQTDTETILYLYREYGDRFIEHLDGDFALGVWDSAARKLVLARDRAGVKPLYYTICDGRFIFASEIKALLRYPGLGKSVDPQAFYHYLTFLMVPPPATLIAGICKLAAASKLELCPHTSSTPSVQKYWLPLPRTGGFHNPRALDEELATLFSAAVSKRLASDVPVGVLFSGGVDSTLNLSAFSRLIAPERVKTFTVGLENAGNFHDDSVIARQVAAQLGSEHHEIRVSERDLLETACFLARQQDEPISDPVAVPLYFVSKLAKSSGVTVLHAGEGADELFCGYDNYRRFMNHHARYWSRLAWLPRWLGGTSAKVLSGIDHPRGRKIADVLARWAKGQKLFMSSAIAYYELEKRQVLNREYLMQMRASDSFDVVWPYYRLLEAECPDASILQQITFIELQLRLPELLLMRADKMSMASSVEVRVPFLDRDLIDFSLRVPDSYKVAGGVSKAPVKRLALAYFPTGDAYRPKTGFGVPIQQWFRGKLGAQLRELLSTSETAAHLFCRPAIDKKLTSGLRSVNEAFQLWVIFNFLVWEMDLG
jgi:asparagine synthase (glutamine-hydrolysing)